MGSSSGMADEEQLLPRRNLSAWLGFGAQDGLEKHEDGVEATEKASAAVPTSMQPTNERTSLMVSSRVLWIVAIRRKMRLSKSQL